MVAHWARLRCGWSRLPVLLGLATLGACSVFGSSLDHFTEGGGSTCAKGLTRCGQGCVDVASDPEHCGSCSNACPNGQVCDTKKCSNTCSSGKTNCNGACVVLAQDPLHCGDCAVACNSSEICSNGSCSQSCFPGQTACGGSCVDLSSDADHCGNCDTACSVGQACSASTCKVSCATGQTECAGVCVDTKSNLNNCGSCGNACKTGEACNAGQCKVACPGGQTECGGLCYDLSNDDQNCGACGNACQAPQVCGNGQCALVCPKNQQACGSSCVDVSTDSANCGTCGNACSANQECSSGKCVIACKTLLNQSTGDPWGFYWDGLERAVAPKDQAQSICESIGGRLPTASELFRVSATQSATVGQTINTNYLWSTDPNGPSSSIEVRLSDGNTASVTNVSTHNYRCVCAPPLTNAYVGGNCYGPTGQACFALGSSKIDIDVQDRPLLPAGTAIWECTFYHGHLASPRELVEAIQSGVGAGSNVYLHTADSVRNDSDLLLRWQDPTAFSLATATNSGATTGLRPFRCAGPNYDAGTHPATIPNEFVGPLGGLKGETQDTAATTWAAAASDCFGRGGHVPTPVELAALVGQGLPGGSGSALWSADESSVNLTVATLETFKWTATATPPYVNGTDLGAAVKTTSAPFRCIYYPIDSSYAGPQASSCAGGCQSFALPGSSGATLWFDAMDRAPTATLADAINSCRTAGGHVASSRDYVEAIRAGLPNGSNAWLWTSDFMLVNTNPLTPTYVRNAELVRWTGTVPAFSDAAGTYTSSAAASTLHAYRCVWQNEIR